MISRRLFAGCGICAAIGLVAEGVSAQGGNPGFTRNIVAKAPVQGTGFDTVQILIAIDPNAKITRHTHPGTESGVVLEGEGVLKIEGQPDRPLKADDTFFVTVGVPHAIDNGGKPTRVLSTYVVERDKPLASPA